jgi:hypothetical protein
MRRRTAVAAALTAGLLPGLTACGGSGASTTGPPPGPVAPVPSSGSPSATPVTPGEGTSGFADPSTPYLTVPSGLTLTAPGTSLALRHAATVAWTPRQGQVGVLKMKVTRIERTTAARAFAGYDVDRALLKRTPYYVHVAVTNVGDIDVGARPLPVYADDSAGELVEATGFADRFAPCPDGDLPLVFAPGDTAQACLVYLTPPSAPLVSVRFQPPVGVAPITWSGTIEKVAGKTTRKKGKRTS